MAVWQSLHSQFDIVFPRVNRNRWRLPAVYAVKRIGTTFVHTTSVFHRILDLNGAGFLSGPFLFYAIAGDGGFLHVWKYRYLEDGVDRSRRLMYPKMVVVVFSSFIPSFSCIYISRESTLINSCTGSSY